eukprot:superscaffoldBa00004474_g18938
MFHKHLQDLFVPLVVRYIDLMESSIAQSIHRGFEQETWTSVNRALYTWMSVAASVAMCCCVTCAHGEKAGRDVHLSLFQSLVPCLLTESTQLCTEN